MAVPMCKRSESKVQFLDTALKLRIYTVNVCKKAPKRDTFFVTQNLSDLSIEILCGVKKANSIYPTTQYEARLRRDHFIQAYCSCQALISEIEVLIGVSPDMVKYLRDWMPLISEEMKLIKGIIKKDHQRYKTLPGGVETAVLDSIKNDILEKQIINNDGIDEDAALIGSYPESKN